MALKWGKYEKHRKATKADWERSDAVKSTKRPGAAQYNPHLGPAEIEALELECINKGTLIRETDNKKYFILRKPDQTIGACLGEITDIVFAELCSEVYHGRPISRTELK